VPGFDFDPQRALDAVRRMAADAPSLLADGFGRLVRDTPEDRLGQLMGSPARKPLLDTIFWAMPRQMDAKAAAGVKTTIRWCITGAPNDGTDVYHLVIEGGQAAVEKGLPGPDPRLTITMDGVEFLRLVSGNSDAMQAYFTGRVQLAGDVMVAAKLAQLFKMSAGETGGSGNGGTPPDA
jgi:hypothetical protein